MFNLNNKNIVITGAASGIGRETAITCAKLGAKVILVDLDADGLSKTSKAIGPNACSFNVNLTDFNLLPDIVRDICEVNGVIDGFVHCAGISSRKPLNVLSPSGFSKVMNVNFFAFEEFLRLLMKRGRFSDGGSVVVMSSISAIRGYKAKTEYCVSKAAVDAFVRCMASELASRLIRINSVMAAEVLTPMAVKAKELASAVNASDFTAPLGATDPYEVANTICFLLSDATKTITGSALLIDGGATIN